jgi:hypothetical protein
MSIFKLKKREKIRVQIEKPEKWETKTQFNVVIDNKLKIKLKDLAKICRIPTSSFTEHCIEVGLHYINQTMQDENKRKILEKHLETRHLLDKKTDDEDMIVRIGEANLNWILLDGVQKTLGNMQLLSNKALEAAKAENFKSGERIRAQLFTEMVTFLNWVTKLKDFEESKGK